MEQKKLFEFDPDIVSEFVLHVFDMVQYLKPDESADILGIATTDIERINRDRTAFNILKMFSRAHLLRAARDRIKQNGE